MTQTKFSTWLTGFMELEGLEVSEVAQICATTPKTIYQWLQDRGPLNRTVMQGRLESWATAKRERRVMEEASYESPPPGVDPDAWPAIRSLLPKLSEIYEAQDIAAHAKRWEWITGNVETFSDLVRRDVEVSRRRKGKARTTG